MHHFVCIANFLNVLGAAWGNYCDLCPEPGSEAYRQLCPGGSGYQPVLEPVSDV